MAEAGFELGSHCKARALTTYFLTPKCPCFVAGSSSKTRLESQDGYIQNITNIQFMSHLVYCTQLAGEELDYIKG